MICVVRIAACTLNNLKAQNYRRQVGELNTARQATMHFLSEILPNRHFKVFSIVRTAFYLLNLTFRS